MNQDEKFMQRVIELSASAVEHGNEPFGAVLVKDNEIVFENENQIYTMHGPSFHGEAGLCNLRRASATDALTSGRLAEQNGRPPDNPNSVLQLDHHDIMLGDPLEDCVSRYCIVHDHGLPFVWFPLGTDDSAP